MLLTLIKGKYIEESPKAQIMYCSINNKHCLYLLSY